MIESCGFETMKHLLELESGVIAYGLYQQAKGSKEIGIDNLKQLMKFPLQKDKKPDFSNIGLTNEMILELSSSIGHYIVQADLKEKKSKIKNKKPNYFEK